MYLSLLVNNAMQSAEVDIVDRYDFYVEKVFHKQNDMLIKKA